MSSITLYGLTQEQVEGIQIFINMNEWTNIEIQYNNPSEVNRNTDMATDETRDRREESAADGPGKVLQKLSCSLMCYKMYQSVGAHTVIYNHV